MVHSGDLAGGVPGRLSHARRTTSDVRQLSSTLAMSWVPPRVLRLGNPNPRRFRESQRPWPMMRWSSSSISSSCPAATISTVSATSAAEGVGSPEGWLWTATMAVACWRTASRKTSAFRVTCARRCDATLEPVDRPGGGVFVEQHHPQCSYSSTSRCRALAARRRADRGLLGKRGQAPSQLQRGFERTALASPRPRTRASSATSRRNSPRNPPCSASSRCETR